MGIKGIYQELGSGQRIALAKLAAESLEKNNRPLRLAIDISIWQFQAQAAKGHYLSILYTMNVRANIQKVVQILLFELCFIDLSVCSLHPYNRSLFSMGHINRP